MKKKYYCGISEDWIKEALFEEFKGKSEAKQFMAIAKFYRFQAGILRGVRKISQSPAIDRQEINVKKIR